MIIDRRTIYQLSLQRKDGYTYKGHKLGTTETNRVVWVAMRKTDDDRWWGEGRKLGEKFR